MKRNKQNQFAKSISLKDVCSNLQNSQITAKRWHAIKWISFSIFLLLHKRIFSFSKYFPPFSSSQKTNILLLQIFSSFSFSAFLLLQKTISKYQTSKDFSETSHYSLECQIVQDFSESFHYSPECQIVWVNNAQFFLNITRFSEWPIVSVNRALFFRNLSWFSKKHYWLNELYNTICQK